MITVEGQWQNFKAHVYPKADENSEQMRQIKAAWFASHFDAIQTMTVTVPDLREGDAVKLITNLKRESSTFVQEYIAQERARQEAGIRP